MSSLTEEQKTNIKFAYENAQALADSDGGWTDDLAAVVETGGMIAWQLAEAFPFLSEEVEDE